MFNRTMQKWVCCLIVVAMPAGLLAAETNSAMLSAKGNYTINGSKAKATAVMAGDRVSTGTDSEAVVRTRHNAVVVPASSDVVYTSNNVELTSGQVLVMTRAGMSASMDDVKVRPASSAARFELSQRDGQQRVAALEGDLIVTNGTQTYTLHAGKQMTRPMRAAAPQGAEGGAGTWAIGLAVAAVATAVVIGITQATDDEAEESLVNP